MRTIFLKIWRSDIDPRLPLLFLKVEATCILAIGFLNDQNCRKKMTNESTYGEICNSASRQKCALRCTQIFHNLIGWTCIVCILFALQRLFHDFNHFTTFFPCKTDEKVRGTFGLKFSKLYSFLEPSLWRTMEFIGEFLQVRLKILHWYASQTIGQFELSLYYEVSQKYL